MSSGPSSDDIDDFLERVTQAHSSVTQLRSGELSADAFDEKQRRRAALEARAASEAVAAKQRATERGRDGACMRARRSEEDSVALRRIYSPSPIPILIRLYLCIERRFPRLRVSYFSMSPTQARVPLSTMRSSAAAARPSTR